MIHRIAFLSLLLFHVVSAVTLVSPRTLHFLVPDELEWLASKPLLDLGNGTLVAMTNDTSNCGWWEYTFTNGVLPSKALIRLQSDPEEFQIGKNGLDKAEAEAIDLSSLFTQIAQDGAHLYFDPMQGAVGWSANISFETRSCENALAMILYDTDASLHGAFSCDDYPDLNTTKCPYENITFYNKDGKIPCTGVTKGIVQDILGTDRKPIYREASACFESTAAFNQLFTSTPMVNSKNCYDLSLRRDPKGDWSFDSDKSVVRGFFPLDGNVGAHGTKRASFSKPIYGTGQGTLATSNVNATVLASGNFPSQTNWSSTNPATGFPYILSYPTQAGEFKSGQNPDVYNNNGWGTCPNESNPGVCRVSAMRNQFFCSESHASFVYRKGQYFYFLGDDDFWLFINNKLVIDLGGMHMPAPGGILLDTLSGLTEGASYPLDLFHCDRRTDMSNFQVQTNIPLGMNNDLIVSYRKGQQKGSFLFSFMRYQMESCATLGDPNNGYVHDIPEVIQYSLISASGDTLDGNPSTNSLDPYFPENTTIYGGIRVHEDTLWLDSSKITLSGTYTLALHTKMPVYRYSLPLQLSDASSIQARTSSTANTGLQGRSAFAIQGNLKIPSDLIGKDIRILSIQGKRILSIRSENTMVSLPHQYTGVVFLQSQ